MQEEISRIEEIRRRAKDNKADNVKYYLTLSFEILGQIRNLLLTVSVAGIGLLQTDLINVSDKKDLIVKLLISIIFGILSYFSNWFSAMYEANYYSTIEELYRNSFPTKEQYVTMVNNENKLRSKKNNYWWPISFFLLVIQTFFLVISVSFLTK